MVWFPCLDDLSWNYLPIYQSDNIIHMYNVICHVSCLESFRTHPRFGQFLDGDLPNFWDMGQTRTYFFLKLAPLVQTHPTHELWDLYRCLVPATLSNLVTISHAIWVIAKRPIFSPFTWYTLPARLTPQINQIKPLSTCTGLIRPQWKPRANRIHGLGDITYLQAFQNRHTASWPADEPFMLRFVR